MKKKILLLLAITLLYTVKSGIAQVTDNSLLVTNGAVSSIVTNGNISYLGGAFTQIGPATGSGAMYDANTGVRNSKFPKVCGTVNTIISDGKGGWYIGGNFSEVGGQPRTNLAHITNKLVVDGFWTPNPNGIVHTLALSGTTVYVGGAFMTISGQPLNRIAAINSTNGTANTNFNPNSSGVVRSIVLSATADTIYVGGSFISTITVPNSIGGQARFRVAALKATDGTATSWNPIDSVTNSANNATINAMILSGNNLFIAGTFTRAGGQARNRLAAIDIKMAAVTNWNPDADGEVKTMALSKTTMYVGGAFTKFNNKTIERSKIAAIDITTGVPTVWRPQADNTVNSLSISGNFIYAGGAFTVIGSGQSRTNVACLFLSNGLATSFNEVPSGSPADTYSGPNNAVNSVAVLGNSICIGGTFTGVDGLIRNRLAAIDMTSNTITSWNPNAGGAVNTILVSGNTVYVGGLFTTMGGKRNINRLAFLNTTNGALKSFVDADKEVGCMALSGNILYVGGSFTRIGGVGGTTRNSLAAIDLNTGTPTSWDPNIAISSGAAIINSIVLGSGKAFIGGKFNSVGGQTRNYIAAVNLTSGVPLMNWGDDIADGIVETMLLSGKKLFVGGNFNKIGAQNFKKLALIDTATGLASATFNPNPNGSVNAMVIKDSELYLGGAFTTIGNPTVVTRNRLAAIDQNTGDVKSWNPNANGVVNAIAVSGNLLLAGGAFTCIGGESQSYLAAISGVCSGAHFASAGKDLILCNSDSTQQLKATGGISYQWSPVYGLSKSDTASPVVNPSVTTTYIVTVTDLGKCEDKDTVVVALKNSGLTSKITTSDTTTFCNGDSVTLSASASPKNNYLWSNKETTSSITVYQAGSYSVFVEDTNGCSIKSDPVDVTVLSPTKPTVTRDGDTLTSSIQEKYQWNNDISGSFQPLAGDTNQKYTIQPCGNFYVTITDSIGCESNSDTVNAVQLMVVKNGNTLNAIAPDANFFQWKLNDKEISGATSQTYFVKTCGDYSVEITDIKGCTNTSETVNTDRFANAGLDNNICKGDSVQLLSSDAATYLWSPSIGLSCDTCKNPIASPPATQTYTLLVTDSANCVDGDTIVIAVNQPPTAPKIVGDQKNGLAPTSNASSYQWYYNNDTIAGAHDKVFFPTICGAYHLVITDTNNCKNTSNTINTGNFAKAGKDQTICEKDSAQLGASGGVEYFWGPSFGLDNDTIANPMASPSVTTTYIVTIINKESCQEEDTVIVNVNPLPVVSFTLSDTITCLSDSMFVIQGGTPLGTGGVYTGKTIATDVFYPHQAGVGNHTIIYTFIDNNTKCQASDSAIITVAALPANPVITANDSIKICAGDSVSLSSSGSSSYLWNTNATTQSIIAKSAGAYSVMLTDSNGCRSTSANFTVEQAVIELKFDTTSITKYKAKDGKINLTVSGGKTPYNYMWSNALTAEDLDTLRAGTYGVTVTDGGGCTAKGFITLTQPDGKDSALVERQKYHKKHIGTTIDSTLETIVEAPTAFSPNGDAFNQYFVIHGLDSLLNNNIMLFNRWGDMVYEKNPYKNDWDGKNKSGQDLPEGTYYYILNINDGKKTVSGYVDLRR